MATKATLRTTTTPAANDNLSKGWRMVRFDELARSVAERVDPSESDADIYVGLEHLDSDSLKIRHWGTPSDVIGDKLRFRKGDIIFGRRRAYQRKLAVAEFDGICSAHAMVVRANAETVNPDFLPFLMQSDLFMQRAIDISVGSLSPTINWKTLRIQEFPLPPKDEQRRIAEILLAIDDAIAAYRAVSEHLAQYKAGLLERLLMNGLCDHPKKETKAGRVPSHWECIPLSHFVSIQMGFAFKSNDFCKAGIQLVRMGNLFERHLDLTRFPVFLPKTFAEEYSQFLLSPGDIIISLTGTTGKKDYGYGVVVPEKSPFLLLNQRVARIIPKPNVVPSYLLQILWSELFLQQLYRLSAGTKQANLSSKQLLSIVVPLPPIEEQVEISAVLESIDNETKQVISTRNRAIELKSTLTHALIGRI